MSFRIFSLISIIILSAICCFGQIFEKDEWIEENRKRTEELVEDLKQRQEPRFSEFVASFLPKEKDAWTISISRSGGFLGESEKLVGLINSKSEVACNAANKILPEDSFADLSGFIQLANFKKLRKTFKPAPSFCTDCYMTTLTINYRRKKNKTTTFNYSWVSLTDSNPEMKLFYEKAKNYASCE